MCSKVVYTGLTKTEIGNWNSDGYFMELVQYAKNLGGKSRKNLVEHQIIRNDKKILKLDLKLMENTTILTPLESLCGISFHHLTKEQNGYSYEMHVYLFIFKKVSKWWHL